MKRSILLFICTALILLCPTLALAQSPLPVTAYLYDPCGGCAGALAGCGDCMLEQALLADLTPVLEDYQATGQITLSIINILDRDNDKQYKRDLAAFDASDTVNHLPAFVVGDAETGVFLLGNESIPELPDAIDSLLLTWQGGDAPEETPPPEASEVNLPRNDSPEIVAPGDSVILYFYKENCPYCVELEALTHALPGQITLPDGEASTVRFIALNKNDPDDLAIVEAYYDFLDVDITRQLVPMMVIGENDLFLYEEIVPNLLTMLVTGEGTQTPMDPFHSDP